MTTQTIPCAAALSLASAPPIQTYSPSPQRGDDGVVRVFDWQRRSTATTPGAVVRIEYIAPPPAVRDELGALLAELEATPDGAAQLTEGRQWVGSRFYSGEPTLAALRLRAGLSQAQLGERCGCQQSHVSRYESGRHEPGIGAARTMAVALAVSLDEFYRAWEATRETAGTP